MADICFKPNGSCNYCQNYGFDAERGTKICLARVNAQRRAKGNKNLENFLTAIAMEDTDKAQALYMKWRENA